MLRRPEPGADLVPRSQPNRGTPRSRRRLSAIIHSLRRKPMALLNLVYRDALFPRPAYRLAWEKLLASVEPRTACKSMVALLARAHDRACEAELAMALTEQMAGPEAAGGGVIDVPTLQARFAPVSATM